MLASLGRITGCLRVSKQIGKDRHALRARRLVPRAADRVEPDIPGNGGSALVLTPETERVAPSPVWGALGGVVGVQLDERLDLCLLGCGGATRGVHEVVEELCELVVGGQARRHELGAYDPTSVRYSKGGLADRTLIQVAARDEGQARELTGSE